MRVKLLLLGVLLLAATVCGVLIGFWLQPPPPAPRIITKEIEVPVEVVREIPGPERVIEKVKFVTREVPIEVPIYQEVPQPTTPSAPVPPTTPEVPAVEPRYVGRIKLEAVKLELQPDSYVWTGEAACQTKQGDAAWKTLFSAPVVAKGSRARAEATGDREPLFSLGVGWFDVPFLTAGIRTSRSRSLLPDWAEIQYSPSSGGHYGAALRWEF